MRVTLLALRYLLAVFFAGAMAMMLAFAVGGYYDASLILLSLLFLPFVILPTGRWHGLDKLLHARYPQSLFFG